VIIYGAIRRAILLATKHDLCASCGGVTVHAIVRLATIVDIFWIPIAPIWISHTLVCDRCGTRTKLGWRQVRAALASGSLPMPPRPGFPAFARAVFQETGRTPREAELDPIEVNPRRGPWDLYLKGWALIVPAAIVGLVLVSALS
jgi:hypothetical protein